MSREVADGACWHWLFLARCCLRVLLYAAKVEEVEECVARASAIPHRRLREHRAPQLGHKLWVLLLQQPASVEVYESMLRRERFVEGLSLQLVANVDTLLKDGRFGRSCCRSCHRFVHQLNVAVIQNALQNQDGACGRVQITSSLVRKCYGSAQAIELVAARAGRGVGGTTRGSRHKGGAHCLGRQEGGLAG